MIDTDTTPSPFDLDMVVSTTAVGLRPLGSGWFEQVLRTPSNRGWNARPWERVREDGISDQYNHALFKSMDNCKIIIASLRAYALDLTAARPGAPARTSSRSSPSASVRVPTTAARTGRSTRSAPSWPPR